MSTQLTDPFDRAKQPVFPGATPAHPWYGSVHTLTTDHGCVTTVTHPDGATEVTHETIEEWQARVDAQGKAAPAKEPSEAPIKATDGLRFVHQNTPPRLLLELTPDGNVELTDEAVERFVANLKARRADDNLGLGIDDGLNYIGVHDYDEATWTMRELLAAALGVLRD